MSNLPELRDSIEILEDSDVSPSNIQKTTHIELTV